MHALRDSQPAFLERITKGVPSMLPKAYRWVGEMEEISAFVRSGLENDTTHQGAEGQARGPDQIHMGLARLYERITKSVEEQPEAGPSGDVKVLKDFVEEAKVVLERQETK